MFSRETAARAAFFSALSIAGLAPGAASACNFVENLFGGCRPAQVYAPAQESAAPEHKRRAAPRLARNPDDYKQKTLATPEGQQEGSIAHFAADGTLRKGDIVVTPNGPLVYGGRTGEHAPAFAPLGRKQVGMSELERASRAPGAAGWTPAALAVSPKAAPARQVQRGVDGGAL